MESNFCYSWAMCVFVCLWGHENRKRKKETIPLMSDHTQTDRNTHTRTNTDLFRRKFFNWNQCLVPHSSQQKVSPLSLSVVSVRDHKRECVLLITLSSLDMLYCITGRSPIQLMREAQHYLPLPLFRQTCSIQFGRLQKQNCYFVGWKLGM